MIEFHWPWMALLLGLPLLARLGLKSSETAAQEQQEHRTTLLHPNLEQLASAFHGHRPKTPLGRKLYAGLLITLWAGLTLAAMRPQWMEPYTETRIEGYDLMLAVDASHSMEALDFSANGKPISRMQVVKGVMRKFIEGRENDRVGLIIFGNQAYVLSPLTLDRDAVISLLNDLSARIAGDGTAMGDAIGLGVKKLRERPKGSRVLVLIADGNSNAGLIPPLDAARLAASAGIRIYAIGVGSNQKDVPIMENGKLITRNDLVFDEAVLKRIAEQTRGAYFRATDTQALEHIYKRIDELEKSQADARTLLIPHPLFRWPLAVALLALLVLGLFPNARPRGLRSEP